VQTALPLKKDCTLETFVATGAVQTLKIVKSDLNRDGKLSGEKKVYLKSLYTVL
jgi:hypothetical protein